MAANCTISSVEIIPACTLQRLMTIVKSIHNMQLIRTGVKK